MLIELALGAQVRYRLRDSSHLRCYKLYTTFSSVRIAIEKRVCSVVLAVDSANSAAHACCGGTRRAQCQ